MDNGFAKEISAFDTFKVTDGARDVLCGDGLLRGGGPQKSMPQAEKALLNHLWPGNVRDLRHCIERAYVLTPGDTLDPHVPFDDERRSGDRGVEANCVGVERQTLSNCLEECERQYLLQELTRNDWQMTKTASAIGISRKNLWERLRRLSLTVPARVLRQEGAQTPAD